MENTANILQTAQSLLVAGELVAIPTETVYGLAANAYNPAAVAKIFQVKNRPTFDPLIVHTHSLARVHEFVRHIPDAALVLAQHFWAGALTLLLPKRDIIPDLVTAGLPTVAVRIPAHPLTLQLLERLDFPLAAPSANPFGYISPTTAAHVAAQLGDKIPLILDGGASQIGIESTIVGFDEDDNAIIYRLGGIAVEVIEAVIGSVSVRPHSSSNPLAPGMLASHYAPRKPLIILPLATDALRYASSYTLPDSTTLPLSEILFLRFRQPLLGVDLAQQIVLSEVGNYAQAAQELFAALRQLDTQAGKLIIAEPLPEQDLGRAINDRLRRASVK